MPRCCVTIIDPQGDALAYAEVTANDEATGTEQAIVAATAMCEQLYPGQPVPAPMIEIVPGKVKGTKFPPR